MESFAFELIARVSRPSLGSFIVIDDTTGTDAARWLNNDGVDNELSLIVRGLFDRNSSRWLERRVSVTPSRDAANCSQDQAKMVIHGRVLMLQSTSPTAEDILMRLGSTVSPMRSNWENM
jgi:hypothetical protein